MMYVAFLEMKLQKQVLATQQKKAIFMYFLLKY